MMEPSQLAIFIGAAVVFILARGPDIVFVVTQGISHGRRAGIITARGVSAGNLVHTTAAAFGLSVVFRVSVVAFTALKVLGVAYLLYLAWKTIRHRRDGWAVGPADGPERGPVAAQMALLGLVFAILVMVIFGCAGAFSGAVGASVRSRAGERVAAALAWVVAGVYVAIGGRLAFLRQ